MLVVRLKRIGKKNKPTYRVVVAENSAAVNGPYVQDLGYYDPHTKNFSIDKDAVVGWFNKGAKPSNTVARLLEKEKVKHKSIVVIKHVKAPKKKAEEKKVTVAPAPVAVDSTAPEATAEVEPEAMASENPEAVPTEEPLTVTAEEPAVIEESSEAPKAETAEVSVA